MMRRAVTCKFVLAIFSVASISVAAEKGAADKTPITTAPNLVRGIDPLSLPVDQMLVTSVAPRSVRIGMADSHMSTGRSTLVFRVQILTAQRYGDARRAVQVAEEIFDQPVHLDYEVPNFKVRVGNFADRPSAEEYRRTAIQLGYTNCWVVPVTVGVISASPLYDSLTPAKDTAAPKDSAGKDGNDK